MVFQPLFFQGVLIGEHLGVLGTWNVWWCFWVVEERVPGCLCGCGSCTFLAQVWDLPLGIPPNKNPPIFVRFKNRTVVPCSRWQPPMASKSLPFWRSMSLGLNFRVLFLQGRITCPRIQKGSGWKMIFLFLKVGYGSPLEGKHPEGCSSPFQSIPCGCPKTYLIRFLEEFGRLEWMYASFFVENFQIHSRLSYGMVYLDEHST